jgi:hypothetical protein
VSSAVQFHGVDFVNWIARGSLSLSLSLSLSPDAESVSGSAFSSLFPVPPSVSTLSEALACATVPHPHQRNPS